MNKRQLTKQQHTVRRLYLAAIIITLVLVLGQVAYYVFVYFEKKSNHAKVLDMVDNVLTYEPEELDAQLELIHEWINNKHLASGDLGRLYERASLIYQQRGEEMSYYRYLGYALYYLEKSDEKDYTVNIYLDLANFFLNNFAYDRSQEMLDAARTVREFDKIENAQVKSYAYRMQGILQTAAEEYDAAEESINKALEVAENSDTGTFEDSYIAITDASLAMLYAKSGRYEESRAIIEKHKDSPYFTQEVYRVVLLRDFVIPYHETKCYLSVAEIWDDYAGVMTDEIRKKTNESKEIIDEFINVCEENGYEKHELNTLLVLENDFPAMDGEIQEQLHQHFDRLYTKLFEAQNSEYAHIINSQLIDSKIEMAAIVNGKKEKTYKNFIGSCLFLALMVIIIGLTVLIMRSRVDGLSLLFTRKTFNSHLEKAKKSGNIYTIIMMDIDDFKHVNDTYGHPEGDKVIERVGEILLGMRPTNVHFYRYGGEEMAGLLLKDAAGLGEKMAEDIRASMESQKWSFDPDIKITLSLGVASGSGSSDVVKMADENLYKSKQSGKNRVTV